MYRVKSSFSPFDKKPRDCAFHVGEGLMARGAGRLAYVETQQGRHKGEVTQSVPAVVQWDAGSNWGRARQDRGEWLRRDSLSLNPPAKGEVSMIAPDVTHLRRFERGPSYRSSALDQRHSQSLCARRTARIVPPIIAIR